MYKAHRVRGPGVGGRSQAPLKFDDMVEVHRYLENNGQFGKIVVTV